MIFIRGFILKLFSPSFSGGITILMTSHEINMGYPSVSFRKSLIYIKENWNVYREEY